MFWSSEDPGRSSIQLPGTAARTFRTPASCTWCDALTEILSLPRHMMRRNLLALLGGAAAWPLAVRIAVGSIIPRHAIISKAASVKSEITAGLVSSAVAIPLSMAFGMFAFVSLGDEYFAYGAMAGIVSAVVAGFVCVLFGDRSVRIYAPRITTTFFLGLLLHSLLEQAPTIDGEPDIEATLVVFFAIILLGGLLQALFGLLRLGSLIKFAPHPVMAGFQNMAAVLLFLVQLGNVLGFDHNVRFTRVFSALGESRPLSLLVAVLTFAVMWNARRLTMKVPPLLLGLGCGIIAYWGLVLVGLGDQLGPVIG